MPDGWQSDNGKQWPTYGQGHYYLSHFVYLWLYEGPARKTKTKPFSNVFTMASNCMTRLDWVEMLHRPNQAVLLAACHHRAHTHRNILLWLLIAHTHNQRGWKGTNEWTFLCGKFIHVFEISWHPQTTHTDYTQQNAHSPCRVQLCLA